MKNSKLQNPAEKYTRFNNMRIFEKAEITQIKKATCIKPTRLL